MTIEGHTDSIGTSEYNLALGERRANSVREYLTRCEVIAAGRMRTVSYGEERPIDDQQHGRRTRDEPSRSPVGRAAVGQCTAECGSQNAASKRGGFGPRVCAGTDANRPTSAGPRTGPASCLVLDRFHLHACVVEARAAAEVGQRVRDQRVACSRSWCARRHSPFGSETVPGRIHAPTCRCSALRRAR